MLSSKALYPLSCLYSLHKLFFNVCPLSLGARGGHVQIEQWAELVGWYRTKKR